MPYKCKLFLLWIVTWSYNFLLIIIIIIISYLKYITVCKQMTIIKGVLVV